MKKLFLRQKKYFIYAIVLSLILSLLQILDATIFQKMVDYIVALELAKTIEVIIITIIIAIISVITSYLAKQSYYTFAKKFQADLKSNLMESYLTRNYLDYFAIGSGEYVGKIISLTNELQEKYYFPLYQMIILATRASLSLMTIFFFEWKMGLITLILIACELLIPLSRKKHIKNASSVYLSQFNRFSSYVENTMNGFETIKSKYDLSPFKTLFKDRINEYESAKYNQQMIITISNNLMQLSHRLVILLPWFLGAYLIYMGDITFGVLMAISQLNNLVTEPLSDCYIHYNTMQSGKEIALNIEKDLIRLQDKTYLNLDNFHHFSIQDIKFSYGENNVINHMSYSFESGKKYLITGLSGSGKSTLIKILSGLISPHSGQIKFDDLELKYINPLSLKNLMAYVPQKPYLFNDSVLNNLTLYDEYKLEEVIQSTQFSQIHDDIMKLDHGYSTLLGASGNQLSGGQLTRLALARALLFKPKLLILDEVTSSLDEALHIEIEKMVTKLDCTVISISHRANSTIKKDYDIILEIRNGHLIESM